MRRIWNLLRPRRRDAWILFTFPVLVVVDYTHGSVRALLLGFLIALIVNVARAIA